MEVGWGRGWGLGVGAEGRGGGWGWGEREIGREWHREWWGRDIAVGLGVGRIGCVARKGQEQGASEAGDRGRWVWSQSRVGQQLG